MRLIPYLLLLLATPVWADDIHIGLIHCLSAGWMKQEAERSLRAMRLAVADQNIKGGLLGKTIKLYVFDTKNDPRNSKAITDQLKAAHVSGAVAFFGCDDDLTLSSELNIAGIPTIAASANDPRLIKDHPYIFQNCTDDWTQARLLAEKIFKSGKKSLIMVVNLGDMFNAEEAHHFTESFRSFGGEIVSTHHVHKKFISFKTVAAEIKKETPNADGIVLLQTTTDAAFLWKELNRLGSSLPIFTSDSIVAVNLAAVIADFKSDFNIALYPSHLPPSHFSVATKKFIERFSETYPDYPLSSYDLDPLFAYDSASVLFNAIRAVQSVDPTLIKEALRKTNITGITGRLRYGLNREATRGVIFQKIESGESKNVN